MIWNTLILALRAIRRNLMRSILTTLGIVIGVAAVVTMVTLGNGATVAVARQISSLGSNLVMLRPGQRMGMGSTSSAPALRAEDIDAVGRQVSGLAAIAPVVSASVTAVYGARNWRTTATGTSNGYLVAGNWQLEAGRGFTELEMRAGKAVCLLGERVRRELFGALEPLGLEIRIRDFSCQVVGMLRAKGQGSMGNDQDDIVLLPLRTVQRRITGSQDIAMLMVSARDGVATAKVRRQLTEVMRERRRIGADEADDFSVLDTRQIADTLSGTTRVLTLLLGAVAAMSLLVGGIGIMNIMLVSVTERTREIGIRLAIGALEREVLMQFLVEAVALSVFGGLLGILIATLASVGLSRLMSLPYAFDWQVNALSFLFSAIIGVAFGYFPARRAARMNPIEALRHE